MAFGERSRCHFSLDASPSWSRRQIPSSQQRALRQEARTTLSALVVPALGTCGSGAAPSWRGPPAAPPGSFTRVPGSCGATTRGHCVRRAEKAPAPTAGCASAVPSDWLRSREGQANDRWHTPAAPVARLCQFGATSFGAAAASSAASKAAGWWMATVAYYGRIDLFFAFLRRRRTVSIIATPKPPQPTLLWRMV
eukprot:366078-Chlamydomonas_euryale.AAC.8